MSKATIYMNPVHDTEFEPQVGYRTTRELEEDVFASKQKKTVAVRAFGNGLSQIYRKCLNKNKDANGAKNSLQSCCFQ